MKGNVFGKLTTFLKNLEQKQISYTLAYHRDEAIMVTAVLPGERWEKVEIPFIYIMLIC